MKPDKPHTSNPGKRKPVFGHALKEDLKSVLQHAFNESWEAVIAELRTRMYVEIRGFDKALIEVVEGSAGETWWTTSLSNLVTELLSDYAGGQMPSEADWCDNIAADFERQATRIRKHANQLRAAKK